MSDVASLQGSFARAWKAAHAAGDEARKLSLFHGWLRFARERKPDEPLYSVLRSLHAGMPRHVAKAHTEEMQAALGVS